MSQSSAPNAGPSQANRWPPLARAMVELDRLVTAARKELA
jgi:hypothetical protein